jgi:putative MFS transporter
MPLADADAITLRLDHLRATRALWSWVGRLALGGFFEVYDVALTAVMTPGLVRHGLFREGRSGLFGYPDQSTFACATLFGIYVGAALLGGLVDRVGRRPSFTGAMVWYAVATLAMAAQSTAAAICVWRFIAAVGLGVEMVTIDCYLAELVPRPLRGRAFSVAQALQLLGVPVAHGLGFVLTERSPWGISGWRFLAAVPTLGALAVVLLRRDLPESPRWLAEHGRVAEAEQAIWLLEGDGAVPASLQLRGPSHADRPAEARASLWAPPARSRVLFLLVANSASSVAFYGFANWLPTLLQSDTTGTTGVFGYTAAIGLTFPIASLAGSLFADRVERKWQIAWTACLSAVLGILLSHLPLGPVWIVVGVGLAGANQIRATAEHTYRSELFPTAIRARAVGVVYSFSRVAAAVSSYAIGAVFAGGGASAVFILLASALAVCAVTTAVFGPSMGARE